MVNATRYVEAPAIKPLPFGILDTVLVIDDPDPHIGFGTEWEPAFCGAARDTVAACMQAFWENLGLTIGSTRNVHLAGGVPPGGGTYDINWGDGNPVVHSTDPVGSGDGAHTYAADGDYTITVTGGNQNLNATVEVTVTNGDPSGSEILFEGTSNAPALTHDDGIPLAESHPFTVYHLFQCRLIGAYERAEERARVALTLGEGRAVEAQFANLISDAASRGVPLVTDVTPVAGTAVDLVDGLAIVEQYAGENYGGSPIIHAPRDVALRLITRQAVKEGTSDSGRAMLRTVLGSPLSAGAGYNEFWEPVGPNLTPAGTSWLVATGTFVYRRAPGVDTGPVPVLDAPDNSLLLLAERPGTIGWECFAVAVLVKNTSEVPA